MGAPKGNQFWKMRSSHGRKPIFASPEDLKDACEQYFQWVEDNPLYEHKAFHNNGKITEAKIPKMRAMTIGGMCLFVGISLQQWGVYKEKKGFTDVITWVETIVKTQKFEGAAADFLNHNIIARDLGLKDKQEHSGDLTVEVVKFAGKNTK